MTDTTIAAARPQGKARKRRSPLGQWMHLEHRYWRNDLTDEERQRFEDLHRYLLDLYREAGR